MMNDDLSNVPQVTGQSNLGAGPVYTTRAVTFHSEGAEVQGTIYLPSNRRAEETLPGVVITGAWTSVQEQMPQAYAIQMAARGFAALTFDFRGWGRSADLPGGVRYKEDPEAKTADIRAAVAFLAAHSDVDPADIHGLGICASAGYMVDAVSGNAQVSSVALVAPWLQNAEIVEAVYGGPDGVSALISTSRAAEAAGGKIIPAAGPVGAEGVLMPIGGYYFEPTRGAIPAYDNKWNLASWEGWLTYYPADHAERLDKPLTVVHSEAAAIPHGVKRFLSGYPGTASALWLENVSQFDFYDRFDAVATAADAVAESCRAAALR